MIPLSNNTAQIVQIFVLCISAVDDKMDKNDERSCYMDYSAANASLWNVVIQLGFIAGAILVAGLLRNNIKFVRKSMMPVAVIGGFLLLILKCLGIIKLDADMLEMIVYHCIALGFIAMSLRVTSGKKSQAGKLDGLKSGAIIVGAYLTQGIAGLIITIGLAYTFMPGLFKAGGLLLPMGFGQGPGQANNVGTTYQALGFTGGHSFGLAIAAAGYICACVVGVIILNMLAKHGKISTEKRTRTDDDLTVGFFQDKNEIPVSDSIDRLSVQLALVFVAYALTFLTTWGLTSGISAISEGLANTLNTLLWGFNFIIGSALAMLVRWLLDKAKSAKMMERQYQNNYLLNRISGFFFDIMIVAGIAAINPEELSGLWVPFILLCIAGAVLTWLYLATVCKAVYKGYYYEGLISMYGMLTGTIGSGILLVREIDPDFETPAANNLVLGSSFAIIFGAPVLLLIGLAPKSDLMCLLTLGLAVVYLCVMLLIIYKAKSKEKV